MKTVARFGLALAFAVAAFAASACAKKEPAPPPVPTAAPVVEVPTPVPAARLAKITVPKSVGADKSPGEAAASFGKKDTVYVSFWVANAPVGTELKARWSDPKRTQQIGRAHVCTPVTQRSPLSPYTTLFRSASFGKKDTVYVSFWVANAPVGTELKARWSDPKGTQ